jgi:hypothetical protein
MLLQVSIMHELEKIGRLPRGAGTVRCAVAPAPTCCRKLIAGTLPFAAWYV